MKDTLIDKRLIWHYKGCTIVPVACHRYANWGKEAEAIDFGYGPRSRYWRIDFLDKTCVHCGTKEECRKYIQKMGTEGRHGVWEEEIQ